MSVRCRFYLLNPTSRDDSGSLHIGPEGCLITDHPPAVGDLISLSAHVEDPDGSDALVEVHGSYRVLDRRWMPAAYGSRSWPQGERQTEHESLDLMVERAPEFFDDRLARTPQGEEQDR